jgi:hypothetical protein
MAHSGRATRADECLLFGGKEDIDTAEYQFDGLNPYGGHV